MADPNNTKYRINPPFRLLTQGRNRQWPEASIDAKGDHCRHRGRSRYW
jgi:hypothetical protein